MKMGRSWRFQIYGFIGVGVLCVFFVLVQVGSRQGQVNQVPVPGKDGFLKTSALSRAERRAYDGAPPVIPHDNFRIECTACHTMEGIEVPDVGFAPATPHMKTVGLSSVSYCKQCHVFHTTDDVFVENEFRGVAQDLREGDRQHELAPPNLPHPVFMRENCAACHTGPAAREEIRCDHPERMNCGQCHARKITTGEFSRL